MTDSSMPAVAAVPKAPTSTDTEAASRLVRLWRDGAPHARMANLVKAATRSLLRALQQRLARHEVALGHWTFLRILWERDGLTKRELSIEAGVAEPTTFTALRAMEALGYVRLEQRPDNRKNVYVFLTPQGRKLKRQLVPLAEEVNAIATRGVPEADVATTRRVLLSMIDNLAQEDDQPRP
jgi:DNA-binding MarR family transcriptional regulator